MKVSEFSGHHMQSDLDLLVCVPAKKCQNNHAVGRRIITHHWPYRWVDGKVRSEKYHIILANLWQFPIQPHRSVILIELVLRIVVLIKESQRHMRLVLFVSAHILSRHSIVHQILANDVAYMVATHLSYHRTIHPSTTQRHNAIERRSTRHRLYRLVVLKQDVQHGLSDSYNSFFLISTIAFIPCIFLYIFG